MVVCLLLATSPAPAEDVVVVKSKNARPYDKAMAGFQAAFKGSVATLTMEGDLADAGKLAAAVRSSKPRAIVAVGLTAAKALKAEISDTPIVFCMAMHPLQNKLKENNSTGVDVEPDAAAQLKAFKRAFPKLKKIGIMYHPARSGQFISDLKRAAKDVGVALVERQVTERRQVPGALREVLEEADSLWLVRDATVVTRVFFDQTLLLQFERKIPVLAYAEQFVMKGALASYSASYGSQGKKAAELIQQILGGAPPDSIPLQYPDGTLFVNQSSASKAGVELAPDALKQPGVVTVGK